MRWLTNFYDFRFKGTATAAIGIHQTKAWLSQLGISKIQSGLEDTLEEWYTIKFTFKLRKNARETYGMLQTAFWPSCVNRASGFEWHKRFKEGTESVRDDERYGGNKEVRTPELIGQIKNFMDKDCCVSIETISAQFNVSVGTVHAIIREELKMQKICAKFVRMHQSTSPSLSQTIWLRWASRQFLTAPIVQTLLPVTFGYSLSSEAGVMRQLKRWKRLWQRSFTRSHKRTSMRPSISSLEWYNKCIAAVGDYFEGD